MKVSIEELRLALQWIKENSLDVSANLTLEPGKCIIRVGTPDQEVVDITLFDADKSQLSAKLTKEDYLKHNVKRKD